MVVTVGGDSVLHAEGADRPGLLTVTDVLFTPRGEPTVAGCDGDRHGRVFNRPLQELTERDPDCMRRPCAEGAAAIVGCRTPTRAQVTGRTQAEGWR